MRNSLYHTGWTFLSYQREIKLGLNVRAGETIFTNEELTPSEFKCFSQGEIKKAIYDAYSSMTALLVRFTWNLIKTYRSGVGNQTLYL